MKINGGGNGAIAKICKVLDGLKPILMMVLVQIAFAGVSICYKLATNDGMKMRIVVAYRFLFAAAFISPIAFFLERKSRPKMTWTVLGQSFLCGLLGASLNQNLYAESLVLTSATFASAMTNLIPAVTFILAILFGLEKLALGTMAGKAKMCGTTISIAGAMVLTLYKGMEIDLWSTNIHILKHHDGPAPAPHDNHDKILGAVLALLSCLSYASWLIVQAKMNPRYPCPYSSAALMCIMASIQAVIYALCMERDWNQWKLGWNVRLLAVTYTGIVASGVMLSFISFCIRLKGPLFVSAFNPLMLIAVAIAGSLMLDENLYMGSVIGAILIICGLYMVLWGKGKEMKTSKILMQSNDHEYPNSLETTKSCKVEDQSIGNCTGPNALITNDAASHPGPEDEV